MNGKQLENVLMQDVFTAPLFLGVYAADTLPRKISQRPALLIANHDPITQGGSHWCAFYLGADHHGEFFDSYGLKPIVTHHRAFLDKMCKTWKYNDHMLQSLDSVLCGQYCVMFLMHRARGYTLKEFVNNNFSQDTVKNDKILHAMYTKITTRNKKRCIKRRISTVGVAPHLCCVARKM